ncbi:hypothetical protein HNV11_23545 [Spirosoma taeanense]|uniref:Uncharacterized protein n=1 Tax=Spirosoma taeanense TaxID=2735870 RepID=A0A6M5YFN7_9BACT|nr:hypothetical protein [Spirosoma taeanense]QJW92140.1 hypothetical protein HNV11_23545 [Spirosoma taeanense]
MKQPRVIQRLSSLLLASLLLFTAVWGQGGLAQQASLTKKAVRADVTAEHSKSGKSTDSHSDDAQLSAAQFEAVVTPVVTLDGGTQTAFLLPAPTLVILLLISTPLHRHFTLPHYFFSYFRHVFGHVIAPNAP